jgi:hypothetical protein
LGQSLPQTGLGGGGNVTIYTIIAVEPFNWVLRTTLKTKCFFPIEDAVTKLISPAISNFEKSGRAVCGYVEAHKSA